jgi:isopentenyl phosphate kinase
MAGGLALIKLGGSVITHKDRPLTANPDALEGLAEALAATPLKLVLVHGGGSFGHYVANRYGLDTTPRRVKPEGVALTRRAMLLLHVTVIASLDRVGLAPYTLPAYQLLEGDDRLRPGALEQLQLLLEQGLTPITFGDVLPSPQGPYIVSGDRLVRLLALALKPMKVIFLIDQDGVYDRFPGGRLLEELEAEVMLEDGGLQGVVDVTGGIRKKLAEAVAVARGGIDVWLINGRRPDRLVKVLNGERCIGTLIQGTGSDG